MAGGVSICNHIDMEKADILREFGKNLRAERNRAGLSQDELAEEMGIVRESISEQLREEKQILL